MEGEEVKSWQVIKGRQPIANFGGQEKSFQLGGGEGRGERKRGEENGGELRRGEEGEGGEGRRRVRIYGRSIKFSNKRVKVASNLYFCILFIKSLSYPGTPPDEAALAVKACGTNFRNKLLK